MKDDLKLVMDRKGNKKCKEFIVKLLVGALAILMTGTISYTILFIVMLII